MSSVIASTLAGAQWHSGTVAQWQWLLQAWHLGWVPLAFERAAARWCLLGVGIVGGHDLLVHLKLVLHLDVCVCVCVGGWVMVGDSTWFA